MLCAETGVMSGRCGGKQKAQMNASHCRFQINFKRMKAEPLRLYAYKHTCMDTCSLSKLLFVSKEVLVKQNVTHAVSVTTLV